MVLKRPYLSGVDITLEKSDVGPMHVRVGAGNTVPVTTGPSLGRIENVVQDPLDPGFPSGAPLSFFSGDSFFDIFFEIDVAGITLFNANPARLEANDISSLPPIGATYEKIGPGVFMWIFGQDPLTDAPVGFVVTADLPYDLASKRKRRS